MIESEQRAKEMAAQKAMEALIKYNGDEPYDYPKGEACLFCDAARDYGEPDHAPDCAYVAWAALREPPEHWSLYRETHKDGTIVTRLT